MNKKNVLHLVEYLHLGGIERLLEQLAVNTKDKAVLHFFTYETTELKGIGRNIQDLGFPVYTFKKSAGRDWKLISELIKVIITQKIDVLHTHDFGPIEYAVFLKLRFPRLRLVHTQHTIVHFLSKRKYTNFFSAASYFYNRMIAVSESTREAILKECSWMQKNKFIVIANGVDINIFSPGNEFSQDKTLKLVSISRLSKEKNFEYLLATCKKLKDDQIEFEFHHAGIGKTPEALLCAQKFIEENGLQQNVFLHGFKDKVAEVLGNGNIFVSASHTEGHPVAVLEAMASEKFCLVSDIAPHRELNDSVVPFDIMDPNGLYNHLKAINDGRYGLDVYKIRKKARAEVLAKYSIEKMVDRYVSQYQ